MADLPQSFLDSMKEILGEDYEAFLTGIDGQRQYGLRVTTQRMFQQSILFIVQGFIIYRSQVP